MEMIETTTNKKTLASLLDALYEAEENLRDLKEDDYKDLIPDLNGKVDGIYNWLERLKYESIRLKKEVEKLTEHQKAVENSHKNLRRHIAWVMENRGQEEVYGLIKRVKLVSRKTIKAKKIEITSRHYLELNENRDNPVVKRAYSFDAKELEKAYLADPEKYEAFVNLCETKSIRFSRKPKGR